MIREGGEKLKAIIGGRLLRGASLKVADCGVDESRLSAALRRTEILCNLTDDQAGDLLHGMRGTIVRGGTTLFREGARGDSMILVASGAVRVQQTLAGSRQVRELAFLQEPAVFGIEAFCGIEKRSVSVRMEEQGAVFFLRRGAFADWVARHIQWHGLEEVSPDRVGLLWIGEAKRRPRGCSGVPCLQLDGLRSYIREAPPGVITCCCARDDRDSALAAFLLGQHGVRAVAMHSGKRLAAGQSVEAEVPAS